VIEDPWAFFFIFKNYIHALITPRGVLTFDPDQFGKAKFRQTEAIGEFLIFEILDLAFQICDWVPLGLFFIFKNYIHALLTPRGVLTFDPDQFGKAKFCQTEAIGEFLIFEILDLAFQTCDWVPQGLFFIFKHYIHALLTPRVVMTFDPDQFGKAKFRQTEAIGEFLIFEILDLAFHICDWGPLGLFFIFKNYIHALLTPRGVLTFDPDQFGKAKYHQTEAIGEFLIFEILDLAFQICDWVPLGLFFIFKNYIHALLTPRGVLTFDPDQFGKAKFRQTEATGEFLIFEFLELSVLNMHKFYWAYIFLLKTEKLF
jgi:hypothetical protein